jgi:hypothetical protein
MDRIPVNSSAISAMAYANGALTVWWQNSNRRTTYLGVPPRLWEMLQGAESKGGFIAKHIKGKFKEA